MEAMRSYRSHLLLWITRGQGRITVSGVTRGFGTHNAIWLPAGTMHGLCVTSAVFGTACFLENGSAPEDLPEHPLHLRVRDASAQSALSAHLEDLQRETALEHPAAQRAIGCHSGLIAVWLERQRRADETQGTASATERLVQRYTDLVERQVMTGQSAGDFAEALGVTVSHLTRACRATCGQTAHDLLADRVTFEARRLLWDTDLPVKRIAEVLGFRSAAYFTRAFQVRAGMTPSAFREARAVNSGSVAPAQASSAPRAPARAGRPALPGWPAAIPRH
jgi:AraC-like DNA-binding protein